MQCACSGSVHAQKLLGWGLENIMDWLQILVLVATITVGVGLWKTVSFDHHKRGWNRPQVSLKLPSGVTSTVVSCYKHMIGAWYATFGTNVNLGLVCGLTASILSWLSPWISLTSCSFFLVLRLLYPAAWLWQQLVYQQSWVSWFLTHMQLTN